MLMFCGIFGRGSLNKGTAFEIASIPVKEADPDANALSKRKMVTPCT